MRSMTLFCTTKSHTFSYSAFFSLFADSSLRQCTETRTRVEAKAPTNDIKAVGRRNTQGVRVDELIKCVCVCVCVCVLACVGYTCQNNS